MKWMLWIFVVVTLVYAQDTSETEDENTRDIRKLDNEGWRIIERHQTDTSGWLPRDQSDESQELPPKRRRLRKRKRRPPVISLTDSESEETLSDRLLPPRRRIRPQRLQQMREPWEELTDEAVRRPYIRRRITPVYVPTAEVIKSEIHFHSNPLGALHFKEDVTTETTTKASIETEQDISTEADAPTSNETVDSLVSTQESDSNETWPQEQPEDEEPEQQTSSKLPDLKMLLKQRNGSLSLSEILQQKNLSLAELLKGSQKAISALTEIPSPSTESTFIYKTTGASQTEPTKYKRIPPSIALKKNTNRNYEQDADSVETLSPKETLEAQRKRFALLQGHKATRIHSEYDMIAEPTTEKRIFVPSHPKYYTSVNFKPDFIQNIESVTKSFITSTEPATTTHKVLEHQKTDDVNSLMLFPKQNGNLPLTSAKLNKLTTKAPKTEKEIYPKLPNIPSEAIKIQVNEIFGFKPKENEPVKIKEAEKEGEPFRMTIDLESFTSEPPKEQGSILNQSENESKTEEVKTTSTEVNKMKQVTAKEEIMEILSDPVGREKLSRILENRNMTVEELVEQRERGSSQLHLADIFHNKTREPEPIGEPLEGQIKPDALDDLPSLGRTKKSRKLPSEITKDMQLSDLFPSMANLKSSESTKPQDLYTVTSFPTFKIHMDKDMRNQQWPFLWPESIIPKLYEDNNKKQKSEVTSSGTPLDSDILRLEDFDNTIAEASNERLDVNQSTYDDEDDFISIPSGVKSAMIASFAIIGLSMIVFLTILFIFRWSQKRKKSLNYNSSFSSKFKSPILETAQKRSIASFMTETLGRKKNYYKSHLQSMSDHIWENDKKPVY